VAVAGKGAYPRQVSELRISARMRLDDVVREVSDLPFGATDCALPMLYALERELAVDTFVVITDNETWAVAFSTGPRLALRAGDSITYQEVAPCRNRSLSRCSLTRSRPSACASRRAASWWVRSGEALPQA
jgi:hypothetical protein